MTKFFVLSLFCLSAFAQSLVSSELVKKVEIDGIPSFFFKVRGDGAYLSYTIPKNPARPQSSGINHLMNLSSLQTIKVPGPWDPVFLNQTSLMVLPVGSGKSYGVFDLEQLLKTEADTNPIANLSGLTGLYQSVGVLEETDKIIKFRVILDSHGKSLADYIYSKEDKALASTPSRNEYFCENTNKNLKLPMLSKDGSLLASYSIGHKKTHIYKINDDSTCTLKHDLGIKTGKVNFNYDNSKVVYHIYGPQNTTDSTGSTDNYIPIPDSTYVSDVFVHDLKTNKKTRLTLNSKHNSMYPDFLEDGTIVFVNYPHEKTEKVSYSFIKVKDGASPDGNSSDNSGNSNNSGSIEEQVATIFKNNCTSCHGNAYAAAGINLEDSAEMELNRAPNDLASNYVWQAISTDYMPMGAPLSDSDKEIVKKWVESGK